jgi:predicted MPP superfamily phosphohydrolase
MFTIIVLMVKYFLYRLREAFPALKKYRRHLRVMYLPLFGAFFIFSGNELQGTQTDSWISFFIYSYFTVIFVFALYGIFIELIINLRRLFPQTYSKKLPQSKKTLLFLVLFLVSFHSVVSGIFMARNVVVEKISIISPKINEQTRIVQISDVHFSNMLGVDFAKDISSKIIDLKPDILICTGDFLDHGIVDPAGVVSEMKRVVAPLGKYAISGNHEYINEIEQSIDFIKKNGFEFIDDKAVEPGRNIQLLGISDKTASRFGKETVSDIDILKKGKPEKYVIFLKHQPYIKKEDTDKFDLMLSGHTHAGQIFPFGFFVRMAFKYCSGSYRFKSGSVLHVNRGTGTWGPPVRFGATSEITSIDLMPQIKLPTEPAKIVVE